MLHACTRDRRHRDRVKREHITHSLSKQSGDILIQVYIHASEEHDRRD